VLYSAENRQLIADASKVAKDLAIELIALEIDTPAQLTKKLAAMASRVDVFWLISDPVVLSSPEKTREMFTYAQQKKVPVVTYNRFFLELGAVLSITADLPTTGRQAALMLQKIISRGAPAASIQFPAGTTITLNMGKVRELGLNMNDGAFDAVNEIIDEQSTHLD
jgi:putative ABC transport system substrate-binding protein